MAARIVTLPGDGIGPEIMGAALELLAALGGEYEFDERPIGGASIDAHGTALTGETLAACGEADAVLLAAVGGPKWDAAVAADPSRPAPGAGPARAAQGPGPVRQPAPGAAVAGAARRQPAEARPHRGHRPARGARAHRRHLLRRLRPRRRHRRTTTAPTAWARSSGSPASAFQSARTKVTSVDKANVLETSRLWRETVTRVHAERVPGCAARPPAGGQRRDAAGLAARPTST